MFEFMLFLIGAGICLLVLGKLRLLEGKALKQAHDIKKLQALSTHDDLTGILNRRGCMEVLERLCFVLNRHNHRENDFAVLLLDLCLFKQVNDNHGHNVGDNVLQFFVERVKATLPRRSDVIARLGGDEFVLILSEATVEQAKKVESMIYVALTNTPFEFNEIKLNIHVSVGIETARDPISGNVRPLQEILRLADIAMYQKKKEDHRVLSTQ